MSGFRNSFRWRRDSKRLMARIPKSSTGFGFTVAWTKPPEINFVDDGSSASKAGLVPGDKILYINKTKVSKKGKEEITKIVKSINDEMELEVEREETFSRKRFSSLRFKREKSKPPIRMEVNLISWKRERALLSLLQCEEDLLSSLKNGKDRFVVPLRRESRLATTSELDILFANSQEVYCVIDRCVKPLRVTTQKNEDKIGSIYLQQMGTRCYSLEKYMHGMELSKILFHFKMENEKFSDFIKKYTKNGEADIGYFIEKPYKYLSDLVSYLECLLSYTAVGHHDYIPLEEATSKLRVFLKNMTAIVEKQSKTAKKNMNVGGSVRDDPYPNLENLQRKMIFTTAAKPLDLIYPGRFWLFAGQLLKIEGKFYVQHWAMLLSDALILTRITKDGILVVAENPLMLENVRHAVFKVPKNDTEFHIVFESEESSSIYKKRFCFPTVFPARKWITVVLRAPSTGLKQIWGKIIMEQLSKISEMSSTDTKRTSQISSSFNATWDDDLNATASPNQESLSTNHAKLGTVRDNDPIFSNIDDDEITDITGSYDRNPLDDTTRGNNANKEKICVNFEMKKLDKTNLQTKIGIPFIDSTEELSSATESDMFLNGVSTNKSLPEGNTDVTVVLRKTSTSDKIIQTEMACSSSCLLSKSFSLDSGRKALRKMGKFSDRNFITEECHVSFTEVGLSEHASRRLPNRRSVDSLIN